MHHVSAKCSDWRGSDHMKWLRNLLGRSQPNVGLGTSPFVPTHRHRKGGQYRLLARGILEADRSVVAIYDDSDGTIWVRSLDEFEDGRFSPIS